MFKSTYSKKIEGIKNFDEAMSNFGIDFEVNRVGLFTNTGKLTRIKQAEAIIRKDTNETIGVVSPRYPIVNPSEKFGIFRSFAEEGILEFVDGGTFGKFGGKVYLQARISGSMNIEAKRGEEVEKRITFVSSYDGQKSNFLYITPYRLVCENGLAVPEKAMASFRYRNTKNLSNRLEEAVIMIEGAVNEYRNIDVFFNALMDTKVQGEKEVAKFAELMMPSSSTKTETYIDQDGNIEKIEVPGDHNRTLNRRENLIETIHSGVGQNEIPEMTLWKLLNGVTYYTNHVEGGKKKDPFNYVYFGSGAALNERAYNICANILSGDLSLS